MKIYLVWVGKTRNASVRTLIDDYLGRIRQFVSCLVVELKEEKHRRVNAPVVMERESKALLSNLNHRSGFTIVVDEKGREVTSRELAALLESRLNQGAKEINFVVGSFSGLSDEIRQRASTVISLSRLTFNHEIARLILVEQIYRAFAMMGGLPYQK